MCEGSPFCMTYLQLQLIFIDMWDIIDKNTHEREIIKRSSVIETAAKDRRNR